MSLTKLENEIVIDFDFEINEIMEKINRLNSVIAFLNSNEFHDTFKKQVSDNEQRELLKLTLVDNCKKEIEYLIASVTKEFINAQIQSS